MNRRLGLILSLFSLTTTTVSIAAAEPLEVSIAGTAYVVDPQTLKIDANTPDNASVSIMPPLHAPTTAVVIAEDAGWRWNAPEGHIFHLSVENNAEDATEIFVDVDAFGEFHNDYDPNHPMTEAQDCRNRLARLDLAMRQFHLGWFGESNLLECTGSAFLARNGAGPFINSLGSPA